jgi:hypothetical protein
MQACRHVTLGPAAIKSAGPGFYCAFLSSRCDKGRGIPIASICSWKRRPAGGAGEMSYLLLLLHRPASPSPLLVLASGEEKK